MMTVEFSPQNAFVELLETLRHASSGDTLNKLRASSWDLFQKRGLPTARDEVFRYVTMRKFFQKKYHAVAPAAVNGETIAPYILPECCGAIAVFINGYFDESLSTVEGLPGAIMMPLTKALKTYGTFLTSQWQRSIKEETDPFVALNGAIHPSGLFIYIPPASNFTTPLQILCIVDTAEEAALLLPRTHLFVGSGSQATVITTSAVIAEEGYAHIPVYEVAVEDNSHVTMVQMALGNGSDIWVMDNVRATVKKGGSFNAVNVVEGGEGLRHDYRVALVGEEAAATLSGLALLKGSEEAHIHALIEHVAPHCSSLQLFKNVLNNSALASFEGKIYVHAAAQKTDAFQLNNNLLLAEGAQAKSKPNLEIFADDVKASHGTTVGQLDDEQLFYLQARGLDKVTAHHILIQGFCRAVVDRFPSLNSVREQVATFVANYIASS